MILGAVVAVLAGCSAGRARRRPADAGPLPPRSAPGRAPADAAARRGDRPRAARDAVEAVAPRRLRVRDHRQGDSASPRREHVALLEDYVHLYTDQSQIRANARRCAAPPQPPRRARGRDRRDRRVLRAPRAARRASSTRARRAPARATRAVRGRDVGGRRRVRDHARDRRGRVRPRSDAPSSVLRDTPLAGAAVHGELLRVLVDQYGPRVTEFVRENDDFYDELTANLARRYRNSVALDRARRPRRRWLVLGRPALQPRHGRRARPRGRPVGPGARRHRGRRRDRHRGHRPVVHQQPRLSRAGTPVVDAPGDHDSDAAIDAMHRHGFTVLEGMPTELDGTPAQPNGLVVLGDADPRVAVLAGGLVARRDETVSEMGHRLATTACDATPRVDVIVTNEPGGSRRPRAAAARGSRSRVPTRDRPAHDHLGPLGGGGPGRAARAARRRTRSRSGRSGAGRAPRRRARQGHAPAVALPAHPLPHRRLVVVDAPAAFSAAPSARSGSRS